MEVEKSHQGGWETELITWVRARPTLPVRDLDNPASAAAFTLRGQRASSLALFPVQFACARPRSRLPETVCQPNWRRGLPLRAASLGPVPVATLAKLPLTIIAARKTLQLAGPRLTDLPASLQSFAHASFFISPRCPHGSSLPSSWSTS